MRWLLPVVRCESVRAATACALGEASAINDTASRIGGVIAVAIAPALIGWGGGRSPADALVRGFEPAMIAMGGLCVASAVLTAVSAITTRSETDTAGPASSVTD